MTLYALVIVAVLATSFVSGVLGMGGGLMLMGVYGLLLPVTTAMILHGITQLASNGSRAYMLRSHVAWRVLGPYAVGAVVSAGIASYVAWVPDRRVVFVALGALALVTFVPRPRLDVVKPVVGVACGLVVTALHLVAGVSGPVLDIFFIDSSLGRREIVATKAVTQTGAHALKVVYYVAVSTVAFDLGLGFVASVIVAAVIGTWIGKRVLNTISDAQFRNAGRVMLAALGGVYLWRGLTF